MQALQGIGVLVTRPALQAMPLCRLFESHGASVAQLPAIQITPVDTPAAWSARFATLGAFDLVVFTSANAVKFGQPVLDRHAATLAAIGPATTAALLHAGRFPQVVPTRGFDSESLLQHSWFEDTAGRRVLLVKGEGGREFLREELVRRGASVEVATVYRRHGVLPTEERLTELTQALAAGAIQVITATSTQIAVHLLELANPALRREFERAHWLVPSARVAAAVNAQGLNARLLLAASADDHDLVTAVVRWRSSVSRA